MYRCVIMYNRFQFTMYIHVFQCHDLILMLFNIPLVNNNSYTKWVRMGTRVQSSPPMPLLPPCPMLTYGWQCGHLPPEGSLCDRS